MLMLDLESLFKLNYGMCIVSSKRGDKFNGCIVNTVFQLTPEPPMVAVSVNRQCLTHEDNTAAFLEAEVTESIDVVTHTLFIAKITAGETLDENAVPMTYNYYRDIK